MFRPFLTALCAGGLVASFAGLSPPAPAVESNPAASGAVAPGRPAFGTFGFDASGMDRSVAPGDDFSAYANGGWVRATQIPADRSDWGAFSLIQERAEKDVRAIIEAAADDAAAIGDRRLIGDYWSAFMDEAGIEARGLSPLRPEFDAIAAIADRAALARAIGESLRTDVDLLNATDPYTDRLFGLWISQDINRPVRVAPYLVQGGLGMPDRAYYLESGMAALREQYQAYVARLLALSGVEPAEAGARAQRIVELETQIARVHATAVETRDVRRGANAWTQADFARRAPGMDWPAFLAGAGLSGWQDFVVWQPQAVAGISALVAAQPLATWREYLAFRALDRSAPYLPKAFAEARFAFYGTALSGTPQQRDRWKRGISAVDAALGEAVGREYVALNFPPATRAQAQAMVANIVAAFGRRIDGNAWMSPATKARARAKLAGLGVGIGYPDTWRDYSGLAVRRDDALGNAQRAGLFEYRRDLAKLGRPVDRGEWFLLPHQINALNIPLENRLIFPAAILQPPFFDPAADDAVNYGAIGSVIGHEISHSFDDSGALFDETGRLANWWAPADLQRFEAAGAALAAQYGAYRPFADLAVNGRLTLGENIADVAGLATAYDAYRSSLAGRPVRVLDGFTPDQRFFLGYAQAWRSKTRERSLRMRIQTDGHAPDQYRTETVRNQDAWYAAFDVRPGHKRYLAPEARVRVW
jgi:putative endopeptidase